MFRVYRFLGGWLETLRCPSPRISFCSIGQLGTAWVLESNIPFCCGWRSWDSWIAYWPVVHMLAHTCAFAAAAWQCMPLETKGRLCHILNLLTVLLPMGPFLCQWKLSLNWLYGAVAALWAQKKTKQIHSKILCFSKFSYWWSLHWSQNITLVFEFTTVKW